MFAVTSSGESERFCAVYRPGLIKLKDSSTVLFKHNVFIDFNISSTIFLHDQKKKEKKKQKKQKRTNKQKTKQKISKTMKVARGLKIKLVVFWHFSQIRAIIILTSSMIYFMCDISIKVLKSIQHQSLIFSRFADKMLLITFYYISM